MKACLIFQRRFTRVAHAIAKDLKERHGVTEFCGYVYMRTSLEFLQQQNEIRYNTLLDDEGIHDAILKEPVDPSYIETLEREYGIPHLWPYINVDRVLRYGLGVREYPFDTTPYSHDQLMRLLQGTARAIIALLEDERPDFIYLPAVSAMGNMLLFHIAKKKGIRVLTGAETRIKGGYAFSDDYTRFKWVDDRYRELTAGATSPREHEAKTYLEEFRGRPQTYHYVMESYKHSGTKRAAFTWLMPLNIARSVQWLSIRIVSILRRRRLDYMEQSPFWFLVDAVRRKFRLMHGYTDLYDRYDPSENFAYYPLHLEPEMAMLLLAPQWTDQLNLIKQVAESLPLSYKLYVKEHPAMMGFRTRRYYKKMKKIPNVKLIHPNHDSHAIIQDAKFVATQTGTAGWEALMLQKPVITFGSVYYNTLPMVKHVSDIATLADVVQEQLERPRHDERALVNFVSALLEDSVDIRLHELWEKGLEERSERESIEHFNDLLMRKIQLHSVA